jgi:hypothetical protein
MPSDFSAIEDQFFPVEHHRRIHQSTSSGILQENRA